MYYVFVVYKMNYFFLCSDSNFEKLQVYCDRFLDVFNDVDIRLDVFRYENSVDCEGVYSLC